jgi:hypothetical protein
MFCALHVTSQCSATGAEYGTATLRAGLLAKRHHDAISARTGIEQMRKAVQRMNFKTFRG